MPPPFVKHCQGPKVTSGITPSWPFRMLLAVNLFSRKSMGRMAMLPGSKLTSLPKVSANGRGLITLKNLCPLSSQPHFAICTHHGWRVRQMDIKSVYLNGSINEDIYM